MKHRFRAVLATGVLLTALFAAHPTFAHRILDSDTQVGPDARILAGYLSAAEKDRLREWEAYKSCDRSGHETYTKG